MTAILVIVVDSTGMIMMTGAMLCNLWRYSKYKRDALLSSRTDSRAHNWRYDSIQEEDHVKEDWHDEKALRSWREEPVRDEDWHSEEQHTHEDEEHYAAEGYQADREDSSRQNSVERADAAAHPTTDIAQYGLNFVLGVLR